MQFFMLNCKTNCLDLLQNVTGAVEEPNKLYAAPNGIAPAGGLMSCFVIRDELRDAVWSDGVDFSLETGNG